MIQRDDVYKIGQITKTHGLKGEVVFNFVDDIFDRVDSDYLICDMDDILVPFFIEEYRFRSDTSALVKFEDMDTADAAQRLHGVDVYFEKSRMMESGEEELSLSFFIGYTLMDTDGTLVGKVTAVDDKTENWLFVVERPDGSEALIPAHEEIIVSYDYDKEIITMDLPIGLLDL